MEKMWSKYKGIKEDAKEIMIILAFLGTIFTWGFSAITGYNVQEAVRKPWENALNIASVEDSVVNLKNQFRSHEYNCKNERDKIYTRLERNRAYTEIVDKRQCDFQRKVEINQAKHGWEVE